MVVLPYSVIYYIYILGTLGLCFNYLCSVYWCSVYGICKRSDTLWPAGRVRLFADYTISLSSLCRLIWRHWTNKMLVRYMLPCVCLRLRLFSQLSFIQYMVLTQLCAFHVECNCSSPDICFPASRECPLSYYMVCCWYLSRYELLECDSEIACLYDIAYSVQFALNCCPAPYIYQQRLICGLIKQTKSQ